MDRDVLNRKLLFVTGKGGTGKTTVAGALALAAARRGKRVLLLEVDMTRPSIADIFSASVSGRPRPIRPGIDAANVLFIDALRAYLTETVSVEMVVNALLRNKVVRYFLESTPYARELSFLNYFYHYYRDAQNARRYDLIVVDLPSSGHAIPILRVASDVLEMFHIGPLHKRAVELQAFLGDQRRVGMILVTLAEELPVNETIETWIKAKKELPIRIEGVVVNRVADFPDDPALMDAIQTLAIPEDVQLTPRLIEVIASVKEALGDYVRNRQFISRLREEMALPLFLTHEILTDDERSPAFELVGQLESQL